MCSRQSSAKNRECGEQVVPLRTSKDLIPDTTADGHREGGSGNRGTPHHPNHHASTTSRAGSASAGFQHPDRRITAVLPASSAAAAESECSHFSFPLRHPRGLSQKDQKRSRSCFRKGKDVRTWSQGSETARKGPCWIQWWSDAGHYCSR